MRKATAPAFSLDNTRKAFPLLLSVRACREALLLLTGVRTAAAGGQQCDALILPTLPPQVTNEVCDRLAERAAAGKDEVDVTEDLGMR